MKKILIVTSTPKDQISDKLLAQIKEQVGDNEYEILTPTEYKSLIAKEQIATITKSNIGKLIQPTIKVESYQDVKNLGPIGAIAVPRNYKFGKR